MRILFRGRHIIDFLPLGGAKQLAKGAAGRMQFSDRNLCARMEPVAIACFTYGVFLHGFSLFEVYGVLSTQREGEESDVS